ncbi:MAG: stalk domain-containing protein [Mycobacterium leprae]
MKRLLNVILASVLLVSGIFVPVQRTAYAASGSVTVTGGYGHSLLLTGDGSVWAWGDDSYGQLGIGKKGMETAPVQLTAPTGVKAISAGYQHTLAVTSDGKVWAWGGNDYGQLGAGRDTSFSLSPLAVAGLTDATAVAAGNGFSLVLKKDGTVWAWGKNLNGQLGSAGSDSAKPIRVSGLTGITAIAAGTKHALALSSSGEVWTWGSGEYGQLGNNKYDDTYTAAKVPGLADVVAISAGERHSLVLKKDGTVWAWGDNQWGQVGLPAGKAGSAKPVQIGGVSNIVSIAAGARHNLALQADGTVVAWGRGTTGQLGNGIDADSTTPVTISRLDPAVAIGAGWDHSLAVTADGTVWNWGDCSYGQLGIGGRVSKNTPVQAGSISLGKLSLNTSTGNSGTSTQGSGTQGTSTQGSGTPGVGSATITLGKGLDKKGFALDAVAVDGVVFLKWTESTNSDVIGYDLFRATEPGGYDDALTDFPLISTTYTDFQVEPGRTYYYVVAPLLKNYRYGTPSAEIMVKVTASTLNPGKEGIWLQVGSSTIWVNGTQKKLGDGSVVPMMVNGRMVAPIADVVKAMGGKAESAGSTDSGNQKLLLTLGNHSVFLMVGVDLMAVDGGDEPVQMGAYTQMYLDTVMAPVRDVLNALGYDLAWDVSTSSVRATPASATDTGKKDSTTPPTTAVTKLTQVYWVEGGSKFMLNGKAIFEDKDGIYDPYLSPDKRYVAYSNSETDILLYDTQTDKASVLYSIPQDEVIDKVYPVGWSADGKELAIAEKSSSFAAGGNQLRIINLSGKVVTTVTQGFRYAHWSRSGNFILSLGQNVKIVDRNGKLVKQLTVTDYYRSWYDMEDVALSADGKTAVYHVGEDYYVHDVTKDKFTQPFKSKKLYGEAPKVTNTGDVLYADQDGIYLYHPSTGKSELLYTSVQPTCANFE